MRPDLEYLKSRLLVDVSLGLVYWLDATKHHSRLAGLEAGCKCKGGGNKRKMYWVVRVNSTSIKRSHIVFLFATGRWPTDQIDHINGNSLDDRIANLREATQTQNAWNHKGRAKKSTTPMGVRELSSGRFQARISVEKRQISIGTFHTQEQASEAYQQKRKEFFCEYA